MMNIQTREQSTLSDLQARFIAEYVRNGGNGSQAAIEAGYSSQSSRQISYALLEKDHVRIAIKKEQIKQLQRLSCTALGVIEEILTDNEAPPRVRLDAAKLVLDRAGLSVGEAQQEQPELEKPLEEMTKSELEAFIREGMETLKKQGIQTIEADYQELP